MNTYYAEWTGRYPNLCSGEWELYKNGVKMNVEIPFQGSPADTYKTYAHWCFTDDWIEDWNYYEDGYTVDEWFIKNWNWLNSIAPMEDWGAIYQAFNDNDWRHGECGGCI